MSKGVPLTEVERAAMRLQYRAGLTLYQIARKMNRAPSTVSGVVRGARINATTATPEAALCTFRLAMGVQAGDLADLLGITMGDLDRLETGKIQPEELGAGLTWWRLMRTIEELATELFDPDPTGA